MSNGDVLADTVEGSATAGTCDVRELAARHCTSDFAPEIITQGGGLMGRALARAQDAALTTSSVFVYGETGTGKDLVARAIHAASARADRPFVRIDCATLCDSLVESELYGHKRGSFTGALRDREGMFLKANRGTLFLDEIDKMPRQLQSKLLGAVEHRRIRAVGDELELPTDVRIISASSKLISQIVKQELLMEELFYRLDVVRIYLPPLRERRDDIPLLVGTILGRLNARLGRDVRGVSFGALDLILRQEWRGNVRQLERFLERALVQGRGERHLTLDAAREALADDRELGAMVVADAQPAEHGASAGTPAVPSCPSLLEAERSAIEQALRFTCGHREKAAKLLGTSRRNLQRLLWKHQLS